MKSQVTKRSECSEIVEQERDRESLFSKVKAEVVKQGRKLIVFMFLKPSTWRWLMVRIPEYWEAGEEKIEQLVAWLSNLF